MSRPIRPSLRPSLGLIGRILVILLLTVLIEFGASTFLYEHASQFAVRDDEARRLAEHLVISRRLLEERSPAARPAMAVDLSTDRYAVRWDRVPPPAAPIAPSLDRMQRQVITWEPSLDATDLRIDLAMSRRGSAVAGGLRLGDGSWLHFRTLEPLAGLDLAFERIVLALIPALALTFLGALLIRRTLLPLRRLAAAADRVGSGVEEHVPEQGPSEVATLVRAFNRMQARIHRLIDDRTQSLAAVAHDLRTPLARLHLRAEAVNDPAARAAIEREVAEMDAMIASMLAYLGGDEAPEVPSRVDVAVLSATVVDDAVDAGGEATYDGPDHLEAVIRASGLKRTLTNLVGNALRYGNRASLTLAAEGDRLVIRIEDDGPGIPEGQLARVLEPFVRLDTARARDTGGFGLGLAIATRLLQGDGGTLTLANRPNGGLSATVELPLRC